MLEMLELFFQLNKSQLILWVIHVYILRYLDIYVNHNIYVILFLNRLNAGRGCWGVLEFEVI